MGQTGLRMVGTVESEVGRAVGGGRILEGGDPRYRG